MTLPNIAWGFTNNMIQLLGNVAVMSQAAWQVFIVLIPVMAACIWYQVVFWTTADQMCLIIIYLFIYLLLLELYL